MAPSPWSNLCTTLFFIVLFTVPVFFLLHTTKTISICSSIPDAQWSWSGDLRQAEFSWNRLQFSRSDPPPVSLKIAVFSRKWPINTIPGGMERHAHTLHTALAHRGHRVHVYTSPPDWGMGEAGGSDPKTMPRIHWPEGDPGKWKYRPAWELFVEEDQREAFDVVHSESVAIPHWLARDVPNLVVTWHGIASEGLQSLIYQDLTRGPKENISTTFESEKEGIIPKLLDEIRFFKSYAHHIAISDSCGEMLKDIYQIPNKRVHVIINGVDEDDFQADAKLGLQFRSKIGLPKNASLVIGVAGRLVRDKGHPLLYGAFPRLLQKYPNVYLVVAGSGPWARRYKELGPRVLVLGSMSPSELRAFYNSIDIFLNPTLRPQGLDLTMMEAMMIGKPIMASRFPSIRGSIVVKDEFGFLFSPNVESLSDTMEDVIKVGAARLAQMGKACREYATSRFTASKMSSAYERLFLCIRDETYCKYS
uniref:Uncharacterized protein n=1 Tax=Kalanchoe fedtschenkoi TaxID=63787 RepID=A0A7N0TU67_KALFE